MCGAHANRNKTGEAVNWRDLLQKWISENPYAIYAKAPEPTAILNLLHTEAAGTGPVSHRRSEENGNETTHASEPEFVAVSWAQWKADALNQLFQGQGVTGQPGRITAATVTHGERRRSGISKVDSSTRAQACLVRTESE
jgi:hypothetical protein